MTARTRDVAQNKRQANRARFQRCAAHPKKHLISAEKAINHIISIVAR